MHELKYEINQIAASFRTEIMMIIEYSLAELIVINSNLLNNM